MKRSAPQPDVHGAAIDRFMAVTGVDHGFASSFLESCAWDLEAALTMMTGTAPPPPQPPLSAMGGVTGGDLHDDDDLRKAIQASMYDAEGTGVRAPDQAKRARIADDAHLPAHLAHNGGAQRPTIVDAFRDFSGGPKKKNLASLFSPPDDLLFDGTFDAAKAAAAASNRWLLVNIQVLSDFDTHRLNRDVWKNDVVHSFVDGAFVFWQQMSTTPAASRFLQLYKLGSDAPTITVIDARTGQKMLSFRGFMEGTFLVDKLSDFLSRHPLEEDGGAGACAAPAPRADATESKMVADAIKASLGASKLGGPSYVVLSDSDDGINASDVENGDSDGEGGVVQASPLAPAKAPPKSPGQGPPKSPGQGLPTLAAAAPASAPTAAPASGSALSAAFVEGELAPEAAKGSDVTRVQFSFPDGRRAVRSFLKTQPVASLYSFVGHALKVGHAAADLAHRLSHTVPGAGDTVPDMPMPCGGFDLRRPAPSESLLPRVTESLADADLLNSRVIVRLS